MTPPTGYRPCTADDLREGVEVLIPATIDEGGYAALRPPNGSWSFVLPEFFAGLALIRDDAAPDTDLATETLRAAVALACGVEVAKVTPGNALAHAQVRADNVDRLSANLAAAIRERDAAHRELDIERAARDFSAADPTPYPSGLIADLRAQLTNATDAAMQAAGRSGRLDEMIKAAAILCEIDADGPEERLSALIDRARGGGR